MARSIRGVAGAMLAVLAAGLLAASCGKEAETTAVKQGETTPEQAGAEKRAPQPTSAVKDEELTLDLGGGVTMELALIRPGSFDMGSQKGRGYEKRIHKVTIKKPFYIGKYEVTQEQWQAIMGANPSNFKDPKKPVESVSWNACQDFVRKLSEKSKRKFSLPSEAEWEYACRAGSSTEFCFGDAEAGLGEYGWYTGNSGDMTHVVGQKKPNKWGLFDMHGNVYEWCEDVWHVGYQGAPTDGSAWTAGWDQSMRVARGGSWGHEPTLCRSADRNACAPTLDMGNAGCRVVLRDF